MANTHHLTTTTTMTTTTMANRDAQALVGEEAEWKPLGNSAWSELHIFKDDSEGVGNFRIVAWIPDTTEVRGEG